MNLQDIERQIAVRPDGQTVFFDPAAFPWIPTVEAHWPAMRQELDRLLQGLAWLPGFEQIQTEQAVLTNDARWKIVPLFAYGRRVNQARCPATWAALQHIPGLQAALFSILEPGKDIPPHRGPYSGVLRYHLGMRVPEPARCGITVAGQTRHWQESGSMVFDDSHMHHAWNHGDQPRVVLFVDFERPLPADLAAGNRAAIQAISDSDFIVKAVDRWKQWEQVYGAMIDAAMQSTAGELASPARSVSDGTGA